MARLAISRVPTAQPQGPAQLAEPGIWGIALHAPTLDTWRDLVGNRIALQGTSEGDWRARKRVAASYGVGYKGNTFYGGDAGILIPGGGAKIQASRGTLVLVGKCSTYGTGADYFGFSCTNFSMYRDGSASQTAVTIGGSYWGAPVSSENLIWDGRPTVIRWGPSGREIWKNGARVAYNASAPGASAPSGDILIFSNIGNVIDVSIGLLAVTDRYLDARSLSLNPWQIFAPTKRRIFPSATVGGSPVNLTGGASAISSANAVLSVLLNVELAGSASVQSAAEAALTTRLNLAGTAIAQALASGNLQSVLGLAGSAGAASIGSGALSVGVSLTGAAIGGSVASAVAAVRAALSGAASNSSLASGSLSVVSTGTGAATASSSASGQLAVAIPLSGLATSLSLATGNLQVAAAGGGTATAGSSATGQISVSTPLTGAAQALSQASATLTLALRLSGAALASSLASAGLSVGQLLAGSATAGSSATGSITSTAAGGGSATASSSATGTLAVRLSLSGAALASAQAVGLLNSSQTISLAGGATVTSVGDADIEVTVTLTGSALAGAAASGQGLVVGINLAGSAVSGSQARGYIGNPPVTTVNERLVVRLKRRYGVIRVARRPVVAGQKRRG